MTGNRAPEGPKCPMMVGRRRFLTVAGAAAAAAQLDMLEFASSLFAAEAKPKPAGKARIAVAFIRPPVPLVVSWPGGNCDVDAQQALFAKTMADAAKELDVELDVHAKPMALMPDVNAWLEQIQKSPPDGLIVCAMCLFRWGPVDHIVAQRGDVPTIVYSNMSGFTKHLQCGRKTPKTLLGATQDVGWLATAVRLLATIWRMRHTRVLLVRGRREQEATVPGLGTVFHQIPKARFGQEFAKVEATDEVRAMADFYAKTAQKIVEPTKQDILEAAKNYVVIRRLLAAEGCQAVSIDCLGWKNPVCLAFSKLLDEGVAAGCEADRDAVLSMLLSLLLLGRPGFMQDPSPNTVNNTLIGAHCTSATKLEGPDQPYRAPFLLRDYHTQTGACPQVLWPVGRPVTVAEFAGPQQIVAGMGRVVSNIPQPPSGCCRTAVEVSLDGVTDSMGARDTRDVKGFHQLFILGHWARRLQAYARLAGVRFAPIC